MNIRKKSFSIDNLYTSHLKLFGSYYCGKFLLAHHYVHSQNLKQYVEYPQFYCSNHATTFFSLIVLWNCYNVNLKLGIVFNFRLMLSTNWSTLCANTCLSIFNHTTTLFVQLFANLKFYINFKFYNFRQMLSTNC